MNASAADIRSALSLAGPSSGTVSPHPKRANSSNVKKPEGISRELYSLIGPSAPTLVPQLTKPRLKQKPNFGSGTRTKWEWRPFKNGARNDNLELWHWVKASTDPSAEYPFVKYNVQSPYYTYSQDEYNRFLEDKEWSKEETDYLFSLVRDYDARWYIVQDRYDYPGGVQRSLEDLKDRYYSVCRKLVRNRPWAGDEASKAMLLSSFQFDKEREQTRKKYIASLENRTAEQVVEEEALYIELKKLEQNERRFKKDREELLRVLGGIDSGLPDIVEDDTLSLGQTIIDPKRKKKTLESESPATPSIPSMGVPIVKKLQPTKNAAYDAQHCITRTELPASASATKAAHQPAYLRSFKLPTPKAAIAPKVTQALAELGISHTRLVMPTRDNIAHLESLLDATVALVETKRFVDKVEYDIQVLKSRLGMRESQDRAAEDGKDDGVDADDNNNEGEVGENGREQSVASVRSSRGSRKHSRRSMSVSSTDNARNTKRQKRG